LDIPDAEGNPRTPKLQYGHEQMHVSQLIKEFKSVQDKFQSKLQQMGTFDTSTECLTMARKLFKDLLKATTKVKTRDPHSLPGDPTAGVGHEPIDGIFPDPVPFPPEFSGPPKRPWVH
jgi:hypothetical protein